MGKWRDSLRMIPFIGFMIASCEVLSKEYEHGGPGVCLGDGLTDAEGVSSQDGRGDALLRRQPPYLTWQSYIEEFLCLDLTVARNLSDLLHFLSCFFFSELHGAPVHHFSFS